LTANNPAVFIVKRHDGAMTMLMGRTAAAWLIALAGASCSIPSGEGGDDWPQFHGPRRDNRSTETGLLKRWPEGGPKLLWTCKDIGHGFASVAIAGGRLYTSGNIGGRTVVSALDLDGKIAWQQPNGPSWEKPVAGTRSTPTVDGDRVYHESPHGDVVCLEAATGKQLWGLNIIKQFHSTNIQWALSESLLIDGDRVLCSPGGPETALVALNKRTGRVLWKSPSAGDQAGYASPAIAEWKGLRLVLTLTSRALIGVSAETGAMLFRFPHETPFNEMILSPVFRDGRIFVSTRTTGSVMLRLDVEGGKASLTELWRNKDLDNQHRGVVLHNGQIYGCSHVNSDGKWVCVDWTTGRTLHMERGIGRGSLTFADGMFYILSERGEACLAPAAPDRHEIVSQFNLPEGGKGPAWAHPVVCGGRLYLRHGECLYAFAIRPK
jgi:outer membrane protein assembly factor BamB